MPVQLHGDDLGLHPSVDRAIFLAFEAGAIGGASILVTGPSFKEASRQARRIGLPLSLHLAVVDTAPISPPSEVRSLLSPDDRFPADYGEVVKRSLRRAIRPNELQLEISRQLEVFVEADLRGPTGLTVDGHQHLHLLPAVFDCLLDLSRPFSISAFRMPRRSPYERKRLSPRSVAFLLAEILGWRARRRAARRGISAIPCWGVLYAGHLGLEAARAVLRSLPSSASGQLLCHPGDNDAALASARPWGYEWELELATALALAARK
jgi:predicted glycoside hydrolase/deacetylase ChbG (UPF0249 family)